MTAITDNPFGDDFELPEASEGDSKEIKYDRWGRYANLPAIPGVCGVQPWTRVTTLAKTLEDTHYLDLWKQRQVIMGIRNNPELLEGIKGSRFNPTSQHGKNTLNSIASQAMGNAGSWEGASKGTKFHDLTERFDRGEIEISDWEQDPNVSADDLNMIKAYDGIMFRHDIRVIPELMERVICVPSLNVAGRLDRVVSDNGVYRIGDVKSQKTLDFGQMSLAIQLAIYANATHILDTKMWAWIPIGEYLPEGIDRSTGVIIWVPAEEAGRAEIHDVDLEFGWTLARAAVRVREWRKAKGVVSRRAIR